MDTCVEFNCLRETSASSQSYGVASDLLADFYAQSVGAMTGLPISLGKFSGCAGRLINDQPNDVAMAVLVEEADAAGDGRVVGIWGTEPTERRVGVLRRKLTPNDGGETIAAVLEALHEILEDDPQATEVCWMTEEAYFTDTIENG